MRDQRQRLQRLAQPHVIAEDAAEARARKTHRPAVAVFLIAAQFGLQHRGHRWHFALRDVQAIDDRAKFCVRLDLRILQHIIEPCRRQLRNSRAVAVGLDNGREIGEFRFERMRERDIDALTHRYETAARAASVQQRLEIEHHVLVDDGTSMQAKPVALAFHHDSKLPRIGGEHAHLLSLGPIDRHHRRQLGQRFDR